MGIQSRLGKMAGIQVSRLEGKSSASYLGRACVSSHLELTEDCVLCCIENDLHHLVERLDFIFYNPCSHLLR